MTLSNLTNRRGKFFPRGCRGFIRSIEIYCNNADTASHTFTVKVSPMPGMGPVAAFTLSVAGGSGNAWRSVTVGRFWNYDSLFIWVMSDSDSYGGLGYDTGEPYDFYSSTDEVSWTFGNYRFWFRVNMTGETVGDLPVSGTVNSVEVPASGSCTTVDFTTVPPGGSVTLIDFKGCGTCVLVGFLTDSPFVYPRIKCDDVDALYTLGGSVLQPYYLYYYMLPVGTGPGVALTKYDETNNRYAIVITVPLQFKRRFTLTANNTDLYSEHNARCDAVFNVIR
jgi:hypothetical protein